MLKKCTAEDETVLKEYLMKEKEYNTFLLADIAAYGFDNPCQDVWMETNNDVCEGIYLRFYTNLLVYSQNVGLKQTSVEIILRKFPVSVIMGKSSTLKDLGKFLSKEYDCSEKQLFRLRTTKKLRNTVSDVLQAEEEDVDDIFHFLESIPQIRALYTSKEMIRDRIINGDGVHLFMRDGKTIISHGNSTTEAEQTVMIGGVATNEMYRKKGYASCVVSALCSYILSRGKTPCLFAENGLASFFEGLGFESLGGWSTLERK